MQFKRKFVNYLEMKNSLQNLTETLQKFETGRVSFPEIAKEFVRLFEELNSKAEKISDEHKEEFATQVVETFHRLADLINPYIEVIALGEENLLSSLDNPNYFDADDWKSTSEAKEGVGEMARKLLPFLATVPKLEESQDLLKKDKKQPPRASKSQWMKS
jgi:negative regulator of genetic competence, sporulation and motility